MLENDRRIRPYLKRGNFLTIRYEDLVREPEATARGLFDFLGCDFVDEYLRYDPETDPYPDRWNWVPEAGGRIDPSHASKWREQLDPSNIARIAGMAELNIGHSIVSRAIFVGFQQAVREMKRLCESVDQ